VGTGFPIKIMLKQGCNSPMSPRFRLETPVHPVTMTESN